MKNLSHTYLKEYYQVTNDSLDHALGLTNNYSLFQLFSGAVK